MLFEDTPSILIIEDNIIVQNSLKKLLSSQNYNVCTANNGEEGLSLVKEKPFDLIFCDLLMPKMDGLEFCKNVLTNSDALHGPIAVLTSLDDKEEQDKLLNLGVSKIILKPYNTDELLSFAEAKLCEVNSIKKTIKQNIENNKKRVLHTLSHEFRTPLVSMKSSAELLIDRRKNLSDEKILKLLQSIQDGGERLEKLISDFMLSQQIEIGIPKREIEKKAKPLLISDIVKSVVKDYKKKIDKKEISINIIDCSCQAKAKICDLYFKDALKRLIDNAIKFSIPNKVDVEIYLLKESDKIILEICDRGIGIDEEKIKNAMDIFSQINREYFEQQGSGLGLFIALEHIKSHRGTLELHARKNGGCVAHIEIPMEW